MCMTRGELADELFKILKKDFGNIKSDKELWKAIAETDDQTCLNELERRRNNE